MPKDNGHSKYDRPNKYEPGESFQNAADQARPAPQLPVQIEVTAPSAGWRSRPGPNVTIYEPALDDDRVMRRNAKRLEESYRIAERITHAATDFHHQLRHLENARQDVELASERRAFIPLKAEQERLALGQEVLKARMALESVLMEQDEERIERDRQRDLDREDFEIARQKRKAASLEARARVRAAEAQLSYANEVGMRRGEAELRKIDEEVFRNEAAAETERRHRDDARRRRRESEDKTEADDMPEPLRKHLATERAVQKNRSHVDRRAGEIRERAAAEGRDLTADEIEEIDVYESAGDAAEGSIRRGDASDLEA